ncbi:unnamed protein product [Aphanomyces euteiches]
MGTRKGLGVAVLVVVWALMDVTTAFRQDPMEVNATFNVSTSSLLGRVIFPLKDAKNATSLNVSTEAPLVVTFPPPTTTTPIPSTTILITPAPTINASETHGVPGNPTDVSAIASDSQAQVSWKAPDDDGEDPILEYEVLCIVVDTNKPLPHTYQVTASGTGELPTFTLIPNLQNGVTYAFKVRAKNVNGYSTWSAKSQPVSPLHPPDLCTSHSCSGNGACFPLYTIVQPNSSDTPVNDRDSATCVCKPGFLAPDCSRVDSTIVGTWEVTPWGGCSNGCGGGTRTRTATCVHAQTGYVLLEHLETHETLLSRKPLDRSVCLEPPPALSYICNGFACGSKLIEVTFEIEMFYDDVLFSSDSERAFTTAFTTEIAAALQIPASRVDVVSLRRGSIRVQLYLLPPTQAGEKSLNAVVADLQNQLNDKTSVLRTQGTFTRRVYPAGVKMSFFIAEQHAAGEAEDISVGGLIGTIAVSVAAVAGFGYCLRKRHERILERKAARHHRRRRGGDLAEEKMRPMGISTTITM